MYLSRRMFAGATLAILAAAVGMPAQADAASIGIALKGPGTSATWDVIPANQTQSGQDTTGGIVGDVPGVPGFVGPSASSTWNTIDNVTNNTTFGNGAGAINVYSGGSTTANTLSTFADSTGTATNTTVTLSSSRGLGTAGFGVLNSGSADQNRNLISEHGVNIQDIGGAAGDVVNTYPGAIALTNIPYSKYDLYIIGGGYRQNSVTFTVDGVSQTFNQNTNTEGPNAPLRQGYNYVHFTGLTDANPSIDVAGTQTISLGAIQIVDATPEPASLSLLALGGLGLLARRRRHA